MRAKLYTECCATLAEEWSWVYNVCVCVSWCTCARGGDFSTICPGNEAGRKKSDNSTHPHMREKAWTGLCPERCACSMWEGVWLFTGGNFLDLKQTWMFSNNAVDLFSHSLFFSIYFSLFLSVWINMARSHIYNYNLEKKIINGYAQYRIDYFYY